MMWGGAFPEPLTFSIRARRVLAGRAGDFDVVHDNQGLGYGMLGVRRLGLPLVTSIHHPISVDRRIDLASSSRLTALSRRRWYGFVRMQARVARRLGGRGPLITVSESSRDDICRDFRVRPEHVHIIPLGVDTRVFRPRETARVPGRIVTVASADSPIKGIGHAAARGRQARHGHRRAPGHRRQARARHRTAGRPAVPGGPGHVHPRPVRRGVLRAAGQRGDRGRAVAVRGLLAARGGAHGLGHTAGGQPHRGAARGHRRRRRPGHAGRGRGTRGRAAAAARLPRRAGRAGGPGPAPGPRAVRLARRGPGHRRAVPGRDGRAGRHEAKGQAEC